VRLLAGVALFAAVILGVIVQHYNSTQVRYERFCQHSKSPQGRGATVPMTSGQPLVVILGDSYASGFGLKRPHEAWPTQLGRREHWRVFIDGVSGTGMVNGGLCQQPYGSRVQQVLARRPQRVVIEVGLNDTAVSADVERHAAAAVLASLTSVPVVNVVGPPPVPGKRLADVRRVDGALRDASQRAGRHYVTALGWQLPYLPDGVHLTAAGHQQFAELVARGIRG